MKQCEAPFSFLLNLIEHETIFQNVSDVNETKGIQISAFGLGDDFDQHLMKGIADFGITDINFNFLDFSLWLTSSGYFLFIFIYLWLYLFIIRLIGKGIGIYFYVQNSDSIAAFVNFALNFLKKSVASNAVLKLRGVGNSCVTKIYGDYDLVKGVNLGIDSSGVLTRNLILIYLLIDYRSIIVVIFFRWSIFE